MEEAGRMKELARLYSLRRVWTQTPSPREIFIDFSSEYNRIAAAGYSILCIRVRDEKNEKGIK